MDIPHHHQDLAIALTLPHLHRKEERLRFLAEQTLLAAVDTYGKRTVRGLVRRMVHAAQSPEFEGALRMMAEVRFGRNDGTDFGLSIFHAAARRA